MVPCSDPGLIVTRLETDLADFGAACYEVGIAQDLAKARAARSPVAVLVFGEQTQVANGQFTDTLGVLIELRDATPDDGQTRLTRLRDVREAIFDSLDGYRPDTDWEPYRYVGGRLFDLGDDPSTRLAWLEHYVTGRGRTLRGRLP
jgi:hypothetical protein